MIRTRTLVTLGLASLLATVLSVRAFAADRDPRISAATTQVTASTQSLLQSLAQKNDVQMIREAGVRREAMKALMQIDPAAALAQAMSDEDRSTFPLTVQPLLEKTVTLQGMLRVEVLDNFVGGTDVWNYYLVQGEYRIDDERNQYRLHIAGDVHAASGDQIQTSVVLLDHEAVLRSDSVQVLQVSKAQAAGELDGPQRTIMIMVNFQDNPATPYSAALGQQVLSQVSAYYKETSYGKLWLEPTVVQPRVYTLPFAQSGGCPYLEAISGAVRAADADVNWSQFDRMVVVLPSVSSCGFQGVVPMIGGKNTFSTNDGAVRMSTLVVANMLDTWGMHIVAHEMGHNLGLYHANRLDCGSQTLLADLNSCQSKEYKNAFEVMGNVRPGQDGAAYKQLVLGWITPNQVKTVTRSGTCLIRPLVQSPLAAGDVYAVTIPRNDSFKSSFWVEYRAGDKAIANDPADAGGAIIELTLDRHPLANSYLLDMTPQTKPSDKNNDSKDFALMPQQSFTDPVTGIVIRHEGANADGLRVSVQIPGTTPEPSNQPPVAVIVATPSAGSAPLAVQLDGTRSSDPEGKPLTYAWNLGDGGTSTQSTLSHTYSIAGTFKVQLTVTDDQGASHSAAQSIVVTQSAPVPVPVPVPNPAPTPNPVPVPAPIPAPIPAPAPKPTPTQPTVSLVGSPTAVGVQDPMTVTWMVQGDVTPKDWIGLFFADETLNARIKWDSGPLNGRKSGTITFTPKFRLLPGVYAFRYLPNNRFTHIAQSNPISVGGASVPSVTLTANPTSLRPGGTTILTWSSRNVKSCVADGGWKGAKATSGSERMTLTKSTEFILTCDATRAAVLVTVSGTGTTPPPTTPGPGPTPGNKPPVFKPINDHYAIIEGQLLILVLNATDADGDTLTYDVSPKPLPAGATFNTLTHFFQWMTKRGQAGTYRFVFTATDGKDTAQQPITIVVGQAPTPPPTTPPPTTPPTNPPTTPPGTPPANRPPVLDPIGDKETLHNGHPLFQRLVFKVHATDPDNDCPLQYSAEPLPRGATFDPKTRTFEWEQIGIAQQGQYQVTFQVKDGRGGKDDETITIHVGSAFSEPRVLNLVLINADTNQPIPEFNPLPPDAIIDLAKLPTEHINIQAVTWGAMVSVRFIWDGKGATSRLDNNPPFLMCGGCNEVCAPCPQDDKDKEREDPYPACFVPCGFHTLTVVPYVNRGGYVPVGRPLVQRLAVIDTRQKYPMCRPCIERPPQPPAPPTPPPTTEPPSTPLPPCPPKNKNPGNPPVEEPRTGEPCQQPPSSTPPPTTQPPPSEQPRAGAISQSCQEDDPWQGFVCPVSPPPPSTPPPSEQPRSNPGIRGLVPEDGLQLWVAADRGALPGAAAGPDYAVAQWLDQSGHGAHAAQRNAQSWPVFVPDGLNGLPVVRFDGQDDFMDFTLPVTSLTDMTLAMVAANDATTDGGTSGAAGAPLFWPGTDPRASLFLNPLQRQVKWLFGTGGPAIYTRPEPIGDAFARTIVTHAGHTNSLYINGTHVHLEGGRFGSLAQIGDMGLIGRGLLTDGRLFKGRIAEILVYGRALPRAEVQQLDEYLKSKYFESAVQAGPLNLRADPPEVAAGGATTLYWTIPSGADFCTLESNKRSLAETTRNSYPVQVNTDENVFTVRCFELGVGLRGTDTVTVRIIVPKPPSVAISATINKATAPGQVTLIATVTKGSSDIQRVEFFDIRNSSNPVATGSLKTPNGTTIYRYEGTWSNLPADTYTVKARVTAAGFAPQESSGGYVFTINPSTTTGTNPKVTLGAPTGTFTAPGNLTFVATVKKGSTNLLRVDFITNTGLVTSGRHTGQSNDVHTYEWTWSGIRAGTNYSVKAKAYAEQNLTGESTVFFNIGSGGTTPGQAKVSIIAPTGGQFRVSESIPVTAEISGVDRRQEAVSVDLYIDGARKSSMAPESTTSLLFKLSISFPAAGTHQLHAVLHHNGQLAESSPVTIQIGDGGGGGGAAGVSIIEPSGSDLRYNVNQPFKVVAQISNITRQKVQSVDLYIDGARKSAMSPDSSTSTTFTLSISFPAADVHTLFAKLNRNDGGSVIESGSVTVTIGSGGGGRPLPGSELSVSLRKEPDKARFTVGEKIAMIVSLGGSKREQVNPLELIETLTNQKYSLTKQADGTYRRDDVIAARLSLRQFKARAYVQVAGGLLDYADSGIVSFDVDGNGTSPYSLTGPSSVFSGEAFTVTWKGPLGHDGAIMFGEQLQRTNSQATGTATFTAPEGTGTQEAAYFSATKERLASLTIAYKPRGGGTGKNPPTFDSFSADPSTVIPPAHQTVLKWAVNLHDEDAARSSCAPSGGLSDWYGSGNKTIKGSKVVEVDTKNVTTTYTLSCTTPGGSNPASITVTRQDQSGGYQVHAPPSVFAGADFSVTWEGPDAPAGAVLRFLAQTRAITGKTGSASFTAPTTLGSYAVQYVLVNGNNGNGDVVASANVEVTSADPNAPSLIFYPKSSVVTPPATYAELVWSTRNTTSCDGSGGTRGWAAQQPLSHAGYPAYPDPHKTVTTFTLTCSGPRGIPVTRHVDITTTGNGGWSVRADPSPVPPGGTVYGHWTAPDPHPADSWIGLYAQGDPNYAYKNSTKISDSDTSGIASLTVPQTAGAYELRLIKGGSRLPYEVMDSSSFTVGDGTAAEFSFWVDDARIAKGDWTKLHWTSHATTCRADGGWSGQKDPSGEQAVSPGFPTDYGLTCNGERKTMHIDVAGQIGPPSVFFEVKPDQIDGWRVREADLHWNVSNASYCEGYGGWAVIIQNNQLSDGHYTVSPRRNTAYSLKCYPARLLDGSPSPHQPVPATVTLRVDGSSGLYSLDASPSQVLKGANVTLTAGVPASQTVLIGAQLIDYKPDPKYFFWSTQVTGDANKPTKLTWTASADLVGRTVTFHMMSQFGTELLTSSSSVQIVERLSEPGQPKPAPVLDYFKADRYNVLPNSPRQADRIAKLSWQSTNTTYCRAFGGWDGNQGTSGTDVPFSPTINTAYGIECFNAAGVSSGQKKVTITVDESGDASYSVTVAPTAVRPSGAVEVRWRMPSQASEMTDRIVLYSIRKFDGKYEKIQTVASPGIGQSSGSAKPQMPDALGDYVFRYVRHEGSTTDEEVKATSGTVQVTNNPPNQPPIFDAITTETTVMEGSFVGLNFTAKDPDGDCCLIYAVSGLPTSVSTPEMKTVTEGGREVGKFTWSNAGPAEAGKAQTEYTATVTVSDRKPGGTASLDVKFIITPKPGGAEPGPGKGDRSVSGKITQADGTPVANVTVEASQSAQQKVMGTGITGSDGSYSIPGLITSPYEITPKPTDSTFSPASQHAELTGSTMSKTEVNFTATPKGGTTPGGPSISVTASPTTFIQGKDSWIHISASVSKDVTLVTFSYRVNGGADQELTGINKPDSSGNFWFDWSNPPLGKLEIWGVATAGTKTAKSGSVSVESIATPSLSLTANPTEFISGKEPCRLTATASEGINLVEFYYRIAGGGGENLITGITRNGTSREFWFEWNNAPVYDLEVWAAATVGSYKVKSGTVQLHVMGDGQTPRDGLILGQVTENGTGLNGVTITVNGPTSSKTAITGDGGRYEVWVATNATYTVSASGLGKVYSPASTQVRIDTGTGGVTQDFTVVTQGETPTISFSADPTIFAKGIDKWIHLSASVSKDVTLVDFYYRPVGGAESLLTGVSAPDSKGDFWFDWSDPPVGKLEVWTVGKAGSQTVKSGPVTVDVQEVVSKPSVAINADKTQVELGQPVVVTWYADGAIDSCTASGGWSGSKSHGAQRYSETVMPKLQPTTTLTLACTGKGGQASDSVAITVLNKTYSISGRVTDAAGGGLSGATVSASGPSSGSATSGAGGSYTIKGLAPGTYTVSVSASTMIFDSKQLPITNADVSLDFSAKPPTKPANQAPTACFSASPESGTSPLNVSFDANCSSDPDVADKANLTYSWDFGDGSSGSGKTTSHQYQTNGLNIMSPIDSNSSFTARLTVKDPGGLTHSTSKTITVSKPKPPATVDLTASNISPTPGQTITLSWKATNAGSCSASWTSKTTTTDSEPVKVQTTTGKQTFTIDCKGYDGVTKQGAVTVNVSS